jgi:hypothetical protein
MRGCVGGWRLTMDSGRRASGRLAGWRGWGPAGEAAHSSHLACRSCWYLLFSASISPNFSVSCLLMASNLQVPGRRRVPGGRQVAGSAAGCLLGSS